MFLRYKEDGYLFELQFNKIVEDNKPDIYELKLYLVHSTDKLEICDIKHFPTFKKMWKYVRLQVKDVV